MKISEDTIQRHLMNACSAFSGQVPELQWIFHVPNGGTRHVREAAKFKSMGVKAGVPDLILPVARSKYHGLALELKAGKNKATELQLQWHAFMKSEGWYVAICYSWEEAIYVALRYLQKNPQHFGIDYNDDGKYADLKQGD
jgi:hypothetical protein